VLEGAILIVVLLLLFIGVIKAFRRNWIVALLLLFVLPIALVVWAFIELFLPAPASSDPFDYIKQKWQYEDITTKIDRL